LLSHATGLARTDLIADPERPVSAREWAAFQAAVDRRAAREPVSRIVGCREFWGLPFRLNSATLDPRADSETLIEAVLERCVADRTAPVRILDIGTGTGCLLIALLNAWGNAEGLGVDLSQAALDLAEQNAADNGVGRRATWRQTDWLDGVEDRFDVVISNPPYIPTGDIGRLDPDVRNHDPHAALDGGHDGLVFYRRTLDRLDSVLAPGGLTALEVGYRQADQVANIFADAGWAVERFYDLSGVERCLLIQAK